MGIDDGWSAGGRCYERLRRTIGPDFGDGVLDAIDRRDTELARVEAERDAAVAEVKDLRVLLFTSEELGAELRETRTDAREEVKRLRDALRRHVCQHVECSDPTTHPGCHAKAVLSVRLATEEE